jgi:hypothetical protein
LFSNIGATGPGISTNAGSPLTEPIQNGDADFQIPAGDVLAAVGATGNLLWGRDSPATVIAGTYTVLDMRVPSE